MNRKDANGTMLRLPSLMAMGHSAPRLARFLGKPVRVVQRLVSGEVATVDVELERAARALFDQLWKYRPPERTRYERAAARAVTQQGSGRELVPAARPGRGAARQARLPASRRVPPSDRDRSRTGPPQGVLILYRQHYGPSTGLAFRASRMHG